jgi:ATP-dependent DNA helicase RecG
VRGLPGVGPAREAQLERLGVRTVGDLLLLVPRRYEDRRTLLKIRDLPTGAPASFVARVASAGATLTPRRRRRVFRATFEDGTGAVQALWFHFRPGHLQAILKTGASFLVHGTLARGEAGREILQPELEPLDEGGGRQSPPLRPVYPATEGIAQATLRGLVGKALAAALPGLEDPLPPGLRDRLGLPGLAESLARLHAPPPETDLAALNAGTTPWHRRLAFEELFALQLRLARRRRRRAAETLRRAAPGEHLVDGLRRALPFPLTAAQERVFRQIAGDMAGPRPMQRLLQGDVGSGKTLVAVMAVLLAAAGRGQAALMVPTELVAEQHARTFARLAGGLGVEVGLLTRSTARERRAAVLAGLASGRTQLVVGTHALLEDEVRFARLALVVIDEQHRFGVRQRLRLRAKGAAPDLLVMTATPIPRSLALALYGDLDLSVIDELPPGRLPVETRLCGEAGRRQLWTWLRGELGRGRRAYLVCPLAEEGTEDALAAARMAAHLAREVFPEFRVGLVHGGLPPEERARTMELFRSGGISLLVATTVVEVGLDVPEATAIVVERAERFGLSQLHQLRGRVGRGGAPARCYFMTGPRLTPEARERLAVLAGTADGFAVAEADLRLRGPGELQGVRQSGVEGLRVADLIRDHELLALARREAFRLVGEDPGLALPEHRGLRALAEERGGEAGAPGGSG